MFVINNVGHGDGKGENLIENSNNADRSVEQVKEGVDPQGNRSGQGIIQKSNFFALLFVKLFPYNANTMFLFHLTFEKINIYQNTQYCADEVSKPTPGAADYVDENSKVCTIHTKEDVQMESEKDRIIANLKKQLEEMEKQNKKEMRRKESELVEQLVERHEQIENLQTTIDLQMAFSLQKAANIANRTPQTVTPIQMIDPAIPEGPPFKILRIKAKERLGTKKPELVYGPNTKPNISKVAEV